MGYWPVVKKVLKDSDVVLEILDARMPELSRNKELERKVKMYKKHLVLVFTKIDLVSGRVLDDLRKEYKNAFFVSGTKNIGISKLRTGLLILRKRMKIEDLKVGVVGYPNMGKSAIINALVRRARAKVSRYAGTTKGIQWIKRGNLMILDSPGVVPFYDNEVKLGLLGSKNPEKIRNPQRVVFAVIKNFMKRNKEALEKFYGIEVKGDEYDVLLAIGEKRKFLRKGGVVDERRTEMQILRDWQRGKLRI